jgi:hypothetical protein
VTVRLLGIVNDHYPMIDGELALTSGMDPLDLPLDRLCNLAFHFATRNASNEIELKKFEARLWRPPAGEEIDEEQAGPWSPESETAAFKALVSGLGQGGKSGG